MRIPVRAAIVTEEGSAVQEEHRKRPHTLHERTSCEVPTVRQGLFELPVIHEEGGRSGRPWEGQFLHLEPQELGTAGPSREGVGADARTPRQVFTHLLRPGAQAL